MDVYLRTHVHIDLDNIRHNITELKKFIPQGTKTAAVIKADAYGHGAVSVAKNTVDLVDMFAVATADEALELTKSGIKKDILILSYTSPTDFELLLGKNIILTVSDFENALALSRAATASGNIARIHIAVDTGMTRIGFEPTAESAAVIKKISGLEGIRLEGVFSHYSCADDENALEECTRQSDLFDEFLSMLESLGVDIPIKHICNSAAITKTSKHYDLVRIGIAMFGLYPGESVKNDNLTLLPAMEFKSHVISVKHVKSGTRVGYGGTFVCGRDSVIATVSAGYADGLPRSLSNRGAVLINGSLAPIVGRICMDQFMADVTDIPSVKIEDEVVLIGKNGDLTLTAEDMAALDSTINYETVCRISRRVPRLYRRDGRDFKIMSYLSGRIEL